MTLREWKKALEFYDIFALQDQLSRIGWKYHNDMNVEHCVIVLFILVALLFLLYFLSKFRTKKDLIPSPFFRAKEKTCTFRLILEYSKRYTAPNLQKYPSKN